MEYHDPHHQHVVTYKGVQAYCDGPTTDCIACYSSCIAFVCSMLGVISVSKSCIQLVSNIT